ncbi:MAG: glycosyltransferase family 39 protein, partial [Planctomycetes bacterium]|nr:glycosyltransferase family 39 protein [Planctomycetota bacterium]
PEFFDQMHVLNDDGRYASRYFPGTGAWLAPFVAAGNPYWGHWLAGGLAAFFVFWCGRELAGNGVGLIAGLLTAVAPGLAIFSNLLLAHHPTLVGLSVFLYSFLRMLRTRSAACAVAAGWGLAFAMLCRPMTAAGFGFPFGVGFMIWLRRPRAAGGGGWQIRLLAALTVPLVAGVVLLFFYNRSITGSGWTTPYAAYEATYTPRHGYGFSNVERGTPHVGPKARTAYDEWAENLTPELAVCNAGRRLIASWEWSLGIVPLAITAAAFPFFAAAANRRGWFDARWWLVPAGILSLHLAHVPYWFTGILHWHYVFETAPLWALMFAGVSACLAGGWLQRGGLAVPVWWCGVAALAIAANWLPRAWIDPLEVPQAGAASRVRAAVGDLAFSRLKYERFQREIDRHLGPEPAIVFIDPALEDAHIEYVVNEPHLSSRVLRGRLLPDAFERRDVPAAFPNRSLWWIVADEELRRQLVSGRFADYRFELVADVALSEPRRVDLWRVHPRGPSPRTGG